MSIIHKHADRFDILFKLSEEIINDLYDVFEFYTQQKKNMLNFVAYKTIRILYLNYRETSGIEQKKFSTYKDDKQCILGEVVIKLKKRITQIIAENILIADRQTFKISLAGSRQINFDFKLADANCDGYLTFDEFMFLMVSDPFRGEAESPAITVEVFNSILRQTMCPSDKIFKQINIFNSLTLEKFAEHINLFELEIAKSIFQTFNTKDISFDDIKDTAIIIELDLEMMKGNSEQKFYFFIFKRTKIAFSVPNNLSSSPTIGVFEYLAIVRDIVPVFKCPKECEKPVKDNNVVSPPDGKNTIFLDETKSLNESNEEDNETVIQDE